MVRGVRALTRAWNALTATPTPRFARVARVAFDIDDTTDCIVNINMLSSSDK